MLPLIEAIRRNHALEHATISLLLGRGMGVPLMGRSSSSGYYIYGDVATEKIGEAAAEALARLQRGEQELAISPFCGTDIAVAGLLAALSSALAMGRRRRLGRLPYAILAATGAILVSRSLGRLAQKYLTTSPELEGVSLGRITRKGQGGWTVHKVETRQP